MKRLYKKTDFPVSDIRRFPAPGQYDFSFKLKGV